MRRLPLVVALSAVALLSACTPHGVIRPVDTTAEKLFADNRFASAYLSPNLATESNTIVLDLEGGLEFAPTKGEFFKPVTDSPSAEVKRQVAAEARIFTVEKDGVVLGYMVKKDKEIPFGRQIAYFIFLDPQQKTWTVRSHSWDTSDGNGGRGGN